MSKNVCCSIVHLVLCDAGGLPTTDGGAIRQGALFRLSGALVTSRDLDALGDLGVRVFVDLRGEDDERRLLQRWARRGRIEYAPFPIAVAGGRDIVRRIVAGGGPAQMLRLYTTIVDDYGDELAAAVGALVDMTPAILGCAAGKDRTGIAVALIHDVLGVADDDLVESYVTSPPPMAKLAEALREQLEVSERSFQLPGVKTLLSPDATVLRDTLDHVRTRWGSSESYLRAHGLDDRSLQRLRRDLVVRATEFRRAGTHLGSVS